MRLTHLKLSGFKSFVDPTTLHIHGQRVGVVGPNGCGKSNVMESVRWVLGESSAKEMRADAMDAVIFNGSGNRKPISRASVELVFDNSLGSAAGEWSQYAEISVKRVIERDKGSTYYINNSVVRRRDVADLFLGTGLGGRAYAIIGQNTISRIVEARPEEMRVFLEEAAGVSKYKERRKETEQRLRDTRENLLRVEDILRELDTQIVRLQSQAVVAAQYNQMQQALNMTKAQIWLLKKRDASAQWEKSQRAVEALVNALEAQMASLRHSENTLETLKQQHVASSEAVNAAQAAYYEANAEVSNLENQVQNTADARDRLQIQLHQLSVQLEKNAQQRSLVDSAYALAQAELVQANAGFTHAEDELSAARTAVPVLLQTFQAALAAFNTSQSTWLNTEQRLRLEQANMTHLSRSITETNEQLKRLQQSYAALQIPADSLLIEKQSELDALELQVAELEQHSAHAAQQEQALHAEIKNQRDEVHQQQRALHVLEAEVNSLAKLQQSMHKVDDASALSAWLTGAGLNNEQQNMRLWQLLRIKSGWESAFEAFLGAKLNAIACDQSLLATGVEERAPVAITLATAFAVEEAASNLSTSFTTMLSLVEHIEPSYRAVLQGWLAGVYVLDAGADATQAMLALQPGECLVNQHGDIYTAHSVTYFGEQSGLHGVLERQTRLTSLQNQLPEAQAQLALKNEQLVQLEHSMQQLRAAQHTQQQQLKHVTQQAHQLNLSLQQLKQQQANAIQRQSMLQADCNLAEEKLQQLQVESAQKQTVLNALTENLAALQQEKVSLEASKKLADKHLSEARSQLQLTERLHQEKGFDVKLISNKINELKSKSKSVLEEESSLKLRSAEVEATLAAIKMEALRTNLDAALNIKQQRESSLVSLRNTMVENEAILQQQERERLQHEQQLHPLRDKLEASRLSEQEARIHFEQCQEGLEASDIEEDVLESHLKQSAGTEVKVTDLERKKTKLVSDIEGLGAVNLAAIEELASEQSRKQYIDSQCQDLTEASKTLEDAIYKIDRETRSRLQHTFDEANKHFNELFTTLFGGGQAKLEMLGDEILDTGMQVFAQPPGKKNSTIHLLSGGEKALTALALVFALFRLNPAPFCLMDEVDAPLDDSNTERFCAMVQKMSEKTQFLYVSHNKITMEMAQQLIGVTMQESGVSRIVDVDMEAAVKMVEIAS
ncbi:chromosome segregation protein SMC [Methylotenera mobilis]|uniref:Chromosome partition protein Smc n=1 Tax=Methylotenera mobilis (strain JLW8 / ATCC BAA-1282 / DSM 17540) TaxID=583345 RepID=C6WVP2_METML|nr:chromosome segregation protein SMC [Methylotenera mobilis]ACT47991.1 chromosome segregation protein SMC [Methylotenera mobilis JLW8]